MSEVIVTGTRVTGLKAADSPAPVQVLGASAMQRVGQPDLIQALSQNLPSFTAEAIGGDTGSLTLSAALRGLNPNDTLVLVNGKRRHPTGNLHVLGGPYQGAATADLSLIPVGAIDHVEVLQDGAAAQYGTDAIAGVVNIILKSANHGGVAMATAGQYYKSDGDTAAISLNFGAPIGADGFVNVTLENRYHGFSLRGGADRRVQARDGSILPTDNAIDKAGVPLAAQFPTPNQINGDAQYNIYNGYLNAGYKLTDAIELYATASYSHRLASAFENYRVPSKVKRTVAGVTIVPFPIGFDPKEHLEEDDYSAGGGVKGSYEGWDWDLSTTYGHVRDQISTLNSANASLFTDTGLTPRNFYDGAFRSTEWTNNLDIVKGFDVGLASQLTVAVGGEARRDTFQISAGDPFSIYKEGGQSYPGFQPSDAGKHHRTNYAVYGDLAAEVMPGLKVDLAGRYEHYSDFGSTTVGKLTARYDFNPMVAIRGTVSSGFRAPTLAEEYYSATNVAPTFAVVQLPANSAAAKQIGFQNLKPEKSINFSGGFVLHPIEGLQITMDAYQIRIKKRIIGSGILLGQVGSTIVSRNVLDAIAAHGNVLDPTGLSYVGVSIFTNAATTRTRGVEITGNYASDFGDMGHVDWSVAVNYNKTTVLSQAPLPAQVVAPAFSQTTLLAPLALSYLTTATPRGKVVFGAFYTLDKFTVNLRETVYGKSSEIVSLDGTGNGGVKARIGTTAITDLDVGYFVTPAIKINIGANNLFDHKAPKTPNIPNGSGGVRPADGANVYDAPLGFSPFGINGGYYYGRVTYTF
ncbi:TonB-dependent receptor [Phenylobacterium sp.]|uniref:TonB-dependent receptor plug domain-containing protein n=1 Tax=Phenylobacterium sp. TaxID=1871053 RepID=UPI0026006F58|nr:TonB-dependent receptor [Phenylobacterium sp.]